MKFLNREMGCFATSHIRWVRRDDQSPSRVLQQFWADHELKPRELPIDGVNGFWRDVEEEKE